MNRFNFQNKKVLVTGGAGFIGSHVVDKLVAAGAIVTVLDNLSTGNLDNLKLSINKINFLSGDITNYADCLNASKDQEIIFHLAAKTSVPEGESDSVTYNAVNVAGTLNLLNSARENNDCATSQHRMNPQKIRKFIFSSSSAVYGDKELCTETDTCEPTSIYGYTKLMSELYCKHYSKYFDTICLRYFNVFGERQIETGANAAVVAKFKNMIKNNQPIKIFGSGQQTRDFVPVETVAEMNLRAATLEGHHKINIASGNSITILELIERLKNEFPDYRGGVEFDSARSGDILNSNADCKKMNYLLK